MDIGVIEITEWHVANGWSTCGYHYVIRRDGTIEPGRHERLPGAHVAGHNADSLGICLVGGINDKGQPDSNFTRAQWAALDHLVSQLVSQYPGATVSGHRDWTDAKACPSFNASAWWGA
jgi:N-acetyl-anhydromuramyl-L-alanine amidase AmpD